MGEQTIVPFPFLLTSINHLIFSYDPHQNDENTSDTKRIYNIFNTTKW